MTVASVGLPDTARPSWILKLLLLAPVLVYAVGLFLAVTGQGMITFEVVDLLIFYLMLAYCCGALFALANRKRAVGFLFLTCSSVLTLGLVELVARRLLPPVTGGVPLPPGARQSGTVTEGLPGLSGVEYTYTVNSRGLRGPEGRIEDAEVRILTVGGSTTECMYVPDKDSWPWALQDKLAARLGKSVYVGSAGAGGHNTLHHEYQIRHFELVPQFQWVVVLCGFNDLEVDESQVNPTKIAERALTPVMQNKAFYRSIALVRIIHRIIMLWSMPHTIPQDPEGKWVNREREQRRKHLELKTLRELPENFKDKLAFYRSNLKNIIDAARSRGVKLVMMTQPAIWHKDMPPELEKLLWMHAQGYGAGTPEYGERMLAAYNQVMREVCAEEKIDCVDLAARLPQDTTVYYDDCHFNISGCHKIADILADFFVAKLSAETP